MTSLTEQIIQLKKEQEELEEKMKIRGLNIERSNFATKKWKYNHDSPFMFILYIMTIQSFLMGSGVVSLETIQSFYTLIQILISTVIFIIIMKCKDGQTWLLNPLTKIFPKNIKIN